MNRQNRPPKPNPIPTAMPEADSHSPDAILDALPAVVAIIDRAGTILAVNGLWRREFGGQPATGWNYFDPGTALAEGALKVPGDALAGIRRVLAGAEPEHSAEYEASSARGRRWFRLMATPLRSGGEIKGAVVMHIDVSDRKETEERLRKVNRLFALLGGINEAITHVREPQALYERACRVAVESGGMLMAWVGDVDPEERLIRVIATAGRDEGYLSRISRSFEDRTLTGGPFGTAMRTGEVNVSNDIGTDPRMAPVREAALARGYRAAAAVPVMVGGCTVAAFMFYAETPEFFQEADFRLMRAIGEDISFALESMRAEQERRKAEASLRLSEERYRLLFEKNPQPMFVYDPETLRILTVNRATVEQYGYSEAEFRAMTLRDIRPPEDIPRLEADLAPRREGPRRAGIWRHRRRDGSLIEVEVTADSITMDGRPARIVLASNITERAKAERRIAALSDFGRELNSARTALEAGQIILRIADRLIGWDAATFDLCNADGTRIVSVLNIDLIDGEKRPCPAAYTYGPGSPKIKQTVLEGAQMVLRQPGEVPSAATVPFGDTSRPSASLLFAPVRDGNRVVGVVSIQSYRWSAYNETDLETLQSLADYCGGAMSRIQAEADLKASQAAMAEAQRIAQMGNWFVDLPPTHAYWSDEVCAMHGEPPGTLPTMEEAFGYIAPESRGAVLRSFERCVKDGTPFDQQMRIVRRDGQSVWARTLGEAVRDTEGIIRRVQGAIQDITAMRRAERQMAAFSELGRRLNSVRSIAEAGEIVVQVAEDLIGWDAATFNLTNEDGTLLVSQLNIDTIDGRKVRFPPFYNNSPASVLSRKTILAGPQLILRDPATATDPGGVRFGNTSQPSMSLMFVPVRDGSRVIGVLSIQSYRPNAYGPRDVETLQALADHCGGAMSRMQAEADLLASQAAMAEAQRIAQMGNWFVDLPPGRVFWSDAVCALHGAPPGTAPTLEEAFGQVAQESRETMKLRYEACARDGTPFDEQVRIVRRDGQPVWARILGEPLRDAAGTIRRVQGAIQDITQRKHAEDALQNKTELLSVVTRSLGAFLEHRDWKEAMGQLLGAALKVTQSGYGFVGVMVEGPVLRILAHKGVEWDTTLNRGFYEEALRTYETKGYLEFTSFDNLFGSVIRTGQVVVANRPAADPRAKGRPAGHPPMHNFLGVPIFQAGAVVGIIAVANRPGDYTEEDQTQLETLIQQLGTLCDSYRSFEREEALRAERQRAEERIAEQAALIDEARDAFAVRDLEHRVQFWSKGAERLYGWSAAEAAGRSIDELLGLQPEKFREAEDHVMRHGAWTGELEKTGKSGKILTVDARWTLLKDSQGRPRSILSIDSDITEKKRTQAHFFRSQRMESIGTLAGGIAHDLNNVLAPILMSLELLKERLHGPEDEELLLTLQTSAQRGADLVRQVLTFARGIGGQRVAVNLVHLLRDIQNIVRDTFPKSIELNVVRPESPWRVTGDPTQLHQVLLNLCVNARDAMPNGGRLTIALENTVVDEDYVAANPGSKPGTYVRVQVADNGTGIPAAIREHIYEPFFTTKELGKGTGLGLSTTLAIVKSHGGFINLYSETGRGSIFKIYLPASAASPEPEPGSMPTIDLPRGTGQTVLVVDDEEGIRKVAQKTLERFGYRVLVAQHGADALSLYAKAGAEIDLVLTDMAMPIMDGPALIVALKSMNPRVKIVASSGLNSNGGVAKAIGAGVKHFIPKPYTTETLLKTLAEVLAG